MHELEQIIRELLHIRRQLRLRLLPLILRMGACLRRLLLLWCLGPWSTPRSSTSFLPQGVKCEASRLGCVRIRWCR